MRKSSIYLFVLGFAVVVVTALASAGLVVSAQNSNSSTTMAPVAAKAKPKPKPMYRKKAMPPCDNTKQEQTDLSGTYTGKLKHGDDPAVDATITITGGSITVNAGGQTHSGTIVAVTTCGYTGVAIVMSAEPGKQIDAVSLRAKKVGDSLTLTSVPGEPKQISFTSGGGMMKPKHRKHKAKAKPAATATPAPKQ